MKKKVVSLFLTACFLLAPSSPTSAASDYDSASSPKTQPFFHEVNADNQQIAVSSDANTLTTDRDDVLMQHFDGTVLEPVGDDSQSTVMAHNGNPFNDVSNGDEYSELIHITSLSPEIIIEDTQTIISSDCVYTATADPEYLEWLLGAPDEIISASTGELLEYFLKSPFMGQQVYSCSSLFHDNEIDFSCHEVFRELVSREDFIDVLESYAGSILYSSGSNESDRIEFEKLLAQPFVESLISDSEYTVTADNYPNLRSIYTASEVVPSSSGVLVGTLNGIKYYSAGSISTANGLDVQVCTPHREWSSAEVTNLNNIYDYAGNTRVADPTTVYNCHSYAWYRHSPTNPYWISDIGQFLRDSSCTQVIPASSAQVNDIIIYLDSNGTPLHSGVVYNVNSSGELSICSKWGQAGAYIHSVGNIPLGYCANPTTGEIRYRLYRYHDYENKYTGNEYHSGVRHYFQYADICEICDKQINPTWKAIICSGPPCSLPMNLKVEQENS